jgi:hypothetical protein
MIVYLSKHRKAVAVLLTIVFLSSFFPQTSLALTSGPTQPEVQSFQQAGASNMVDVFSGDFSYNIPLFELPGPNGGYPFNLSYQSGITMDQEASWVGLGWSLQPGAITRQMRGLPDEFNGDEVTTKMSVKPSITVGLGAGGTFEKFGANKGLKVGLSFYNNNYKGFGYSIDGSFGFEKASKSGRTAGLGLGFTLDSNEGLTVSPSLSLSGKTGEIGLSTSYNAMSGLSNIGLSVQKYKSTVTKNGEPVEPKALSIPMQASSTLSFSNPGYTPQISMPMRNINLNLTIKGGASWWGLFGSMYVSGFYNNQSLARKTATSKAYGYLNYQNADESSMLDINREKDGIVSKETPNLAMPSQTYDIYSVTGQGIGMMYRPFRNDYGVVYDNKVESTGTAIGIGADFAGWASTVGINLDMNISGSSSGKWMDKNAVVDNSKAAFHDKRLNSPYEPWYFKVHGEPTAENFQDFEKIGFEKAANFKLAGNKINVALTEAMELSGGTGATLNLPDNKTLNQERKIRSNVVTPITNDELMGTDGIELLNHYKIKYKQSSGGSEIAYSRAGHDGHHFAGYTAVTPEGLRYVYALPAYNLKQEEVTFSTSGNGLVGSGAVTVGESTNDNGDPTYDTGDKLLKKTNIPRYAHSYMLTAILGADYVDVGNDGVDAKDLGYWVKFTYVRLWGNNGETDGYKWRDPFAGGHFSEGWKTDANDNKGSFSFGLKEIWHLDQAETKSHIARFAISARQDAFGAAQKLQDDNTVNKTGKSSFKLDEIALYTRLDLVSSGTGAKPIKKVKFYYDPTKTLCSGAPNGTAGKLALTKVWFEYGGSQRGAANPYEFTYNAGPAYDAMAYDRWGYYKPAPDKSLARDFPYCRQDPALKSTIDGDVSSWSIKSIKLPSGGEIMVDYETDDYAYVQQKPAMQMMELIDPIPTLPGGTLKNDIIMEEGNLKVRFKLEKTVPVPTGTTSQIEAANDLEVLKYLDQQTWQLYFKVSVKLKRSGAEQYEHVSGYANINPSASTMGLEKAASGDNFYTYGYFAFEGEDTGFPIPGSAGTDLINPMVYRALQHLRTNQPNLVREANSVADKSAAADKKNQILALVPFVGMIKQMMSGYNQYCLNLGLGKNIKSNRSWIRLNSPDRIKYGGGLRVKQVTIKDTKWATTGNDEQVVYGQVYDYTTVENGATISSGVATYEPFIGGDENALRYAKKYVESVPLRSDNNMYFEYPINESYYPGPSVGYSKVTVMSLAAAGLEGKIVLTPSSGTVVPGKASDGFKYGTSGKTVNEFYTAKDFPVITDETRKLFKNFPLNLTLFGLGNISITQLSATQGYSIITNDMHGKQKMVSNYRQIKDTGLFEPEPISWVRYNYMSDVKLYNKAKVSMLSNVMKDNGDGTLRKIIPADGAVPASEKKYFGQEVEFFHDMREYKDISAGGGLRWNIDVVNIPVVFGFVPVPIPSGWPNLTYSNNRLRTAVTNKVIFRAGILESVEAFDGGSMVKTTNERWDKITGQVVLSTVTNDFDAPVFSYTRLAYNEYQGMGAAFSTQGMTLLLENVQTDPGNQSQKWYTFRSDALSSLYPGDEILIFKTEDTPMKQPLGRVFYVGSMDDREILFSATDLTEADTYRAIIIRPGRRNQLSVSAQTISALSNPSVPGTPKTYSQQISVPQ